jgi:hypothetical protein
MCSILPPPPSPLERMRPQLSRITDNLNSLSSTVIFNFYVQVPIITLFSLSVPYPAPVGTYFSNDNCNTPT